jgi:hypothetical protein
VNDTSCFSANPTGEGTFECQVLREDRIAVAVAIYYVYSGEHSILQTVDTLPGLAAVLDGSGEMRLLSQNESLATRMWLAKSNISTFFLARDDQNYNLPVALIKAAKVEVLASHGFQRIF